jgi:hypothetical protein
MYITRRKRHRLDRIPPLPIPRERGFIFNNLFRGGDGIRYYVTAPHRGKAPIK